MFYGCITIKVSVLIGKKGLATIDIVILIRSRVQTTDASTLSPQEGAKAEGLVSGKMLLLAF